jgi:anthranilate/para-aminobenzoate synthase component I
MLIDLARNDIGRIAETGSVKVTDRWSSKNTRMCSTSSPTSKAS